MRNLKLTTLALCLVFAVFGCTNDKASSTSTTTSSLPTDIEGSMADQTQEDFARVAAPLVKLTFGNPIGTYQGIRSGDTVFVCTATVSEVLAGDADAGAVLNVPCAVDDAKTGAIYNGLGTAPPNGGDIEMVFLLAAEHGAMQKSVTASDGVTLDTPVWAIQPVAATVSGTAVRAPTAFAEQVPVDVEAYQAALANQ